MSAINGLKIAQKIEEMELYGRQALRHFPRAEKPASAAEMRYCMQQMMRLTIRAARQHKNQTVLGYLSDEVDMLRYNVRMARIEGHLPKKKYEVWSKHLDEIGRMVGGWLNSTKKG